MEAIQTRAWTTLGEPLTGTHKYELHFDAGKIPPVIVFWNMPTYTSDMLFIENDFGRHSIGSTTDGLKKDSDGSLTILIQEDKTARHLKTGYPLLQETSI